MSCAANVSSGADVDGGICTSARFRRRLLFILLAALLCRITLLIFVEQRPQRFDFPDSHRYIRVAHNIAAGRGPIESDTVRAGTDPLYPAILSIPILFGAESDKAILRWGRIVNVVFALLSIALLAALARRLVFEGAALIAAAILAIDPILLYFNALVLTETCYIALLLTALYGLVRCNWMSMIGAGFCMGLGILLRSSSLFLPLVLLPFVWYFARRPADGSQKKLIASPAVACAIFLISTIVLLIPTIIRNYQIFDRVVITRTGGGASLLEALGPWADGGPGMDRIVYPSTPPNMNEVERDQLYKRTAWNWARDNPSAAFKLTWAKLLRTWSVAIQAPGYHHPAYAAICWLTVAPEFILAIYGLWLLRKRPWLPALLLAPAIYYTLVHAVYVGSVRYRVPAMPLIFVLVGVAIFHLCCSLTRRRPI